MPAFVQFSTNLTEFPPKHTEFRNYLRVLGIQQWTILGRYGAMHSRLWALLEALEWILGYLGKVLNDYTYVGCTERH